MPNLTITTLWTDCNVKNTCPGEHRVAERPDVHYVITRVVTDQAAADAYLTAHGLRLQRGEVLGEVPAEMSPDGYLISRLVTDAVELAVFADRMGPGEQLGTIPARDRALLGAGA
jgi:hypothetical protein